MASVLIAEDDRLVSFVMIEVLERSGHTVQHAVDGREAIAMLAQSRPPVDLAVIDLVMPQLDGAKVLAFCRERFPALPVILTSGYTQAYAETRLQGLSPDAFLAKPWHVDALTEAIERLLANARIQADAGVKSPRVA